MTRYVSIAIFPLKDEYTYKIPSEFSQEISIGMKVKVPLGRRSSLGYVTDIFDNPPEGFPEEKIKAFSLSPKPVKVFHESDFPFLKWIAQYYSVPLSVTLDTAAPNLVPIKNEKAFSLIGESLPKLTGKNQIEIVKTLRDLGGDKVPLSDLKSHCSAPSASLKRLIEKGYISTDSVEVIFSGEEVIKEKTKVLSSEQHHAAHTISECIRDNSFKTFLLHGITGSGKTEVYNTCIRECLARSQGAIIIVPEISLTPQLISRVSSQIGEEIAILHSGLSQTVRSSYWHALVKGTLRVALGARSAIFAPVANVGLIVVDEEHDPSFKQQDGLRYNARDLAIVRARMSNAPVVLGSATPSMESLYNAQNNKYELLTLKARHGKAKLPEIHCLSLIDTKPWDMASPGITSALKQEIEKTLVRKEQCFLLYNRRGYANYYLCESCGSTLRCQHCDVTLTFHHSSAKLLCHYCGTAGTVPEHCADCNKPSLIMKGSGTEKIVEEISSLFPEASIERLDRDRVRKIEEYEEILKRLRSKDIDILVGTQMIAKGHDLPEVTLVGIVDCDVGLHVPDFRAAERVFHLLTQAAGRAGRGEKPGKVFLQTRSPLHPSIRKTIEDNFGGFASLELKNRKELGYPPYVRILRVLASAESQTLPLEYLDYCRKKAKKIGETFDTSFQILGPVPAPITRIKDRWRWHLLIKMESPKLLHKMMVLLKFNTTPPKEIRVAFDMDPQDML